MVLIRASSSMVERSRLSRDWLVILGMILYVLYNKEHDKYYVGVTDDLNRRLHEHNTKSKHFTGRLDGNWIVQYAKEYQSRSEAFKEEKRLKTARNRKYLEWYIKNV